MPKKNKYRYRSSETGLFVTADYAKQHPKSTVRERIKERLKGVVITSNIVG